MCSVGSSVQQMVSRALAMLLIVNLATTPYCTASAITGTVVSVHDGDTLRVADAASGSTVRIRVFGVDAPEIAQSCTAASSAPYACGQVARQALLDAVAGQAVKCEVQSVDKYDRRVAICYANSGRGPDLGRTLVATGAAVAYRHYSKRYVPDEEAAKKAKLGLWAGSFTLPWDFRRQQLSSSAGSSAAGSSAADSSAADSSDCLVKGNIASDGDKVYHLPGSTHYSSTQIREASGERWFCNAHEAELAGWRPGGCSIKGDIDATSRKKHYYTSQHSQYKAVRVEVARGERWFCSSGEATAAGWKAAPATSNSSGRSSLLGRGL
ncbi:hypothetical protein COO60DRAFT_1697453 [Scenedesmus sp. NREL 46B-D3]|nr:hypothetical protein COO60DRAFT_1697453 [Scenedesmus sp. NREL 46B-D3]